MAGRSAGRPCAWRGCPYLVRGQHRYCNERHQAEELAEKAARDERRGSSASRGYGGRWQRERAAHLAAFPLCADPLELHLGQTRAGQVVDHKEPHRGNAELFWDRDNWQTLCFECHTEKTARGK